MVAHCCLAPSGEEAQYAKIVFIRQHDQWFVTSRALSQEYVYHDIILDNRTNFRVKVLAAVPTQGKHWWSSIHNLIQFHESCYGDPFSTKVTLGPRASKGLRIKYVSIDKVYDAMEFHGLRFQLSTKSNSVSLDVRPPKEQLAKKTADESFEFLVTRLVQVLDAF
ncbi:hypothetical protein PR003_g3187 [Phytophthora rubi]|uniref:Uncharacterized protein n=1 Tax=Phytophthora rubi TaxID=129364 RepID=A0A6A3NL90_9STRA|nr:hypothetical protein PR002_g3555 [Phytophthora rubi]KAE9049797.1 hypothetical protein PR001_g2976 [Phytophthora rubi]KAE9354769.1 hypothetical protein PR003_g3187 [Phytophthora rubi]